ncbi:MAG: hypothetical protein PHI65_07315 [Firmicutes bacterium]|nr:hypothetical protein [Bacillota bacterium]
MLTKGTGVYAHGVEVPADYKVEILGRFAVIDLMSSKLLVFLGEPYNDEDFSEAVNICMERIKKFNPEVYGYQYAEELAPRTQLTSMGWRGYIEMRPVESLV